MRGTGRVTAVAPLLPSRHTPPRTPATRRRAPRGAAGGGRGAGGTASPSPARGAAMATITG